MPCGKVHDLLRERIALKDEVLRCRLTGEGSVRFDGDRLGGKTRLEGKLPLGKGASDDLEGPAAVHKRAFVVAARHGALTRRTRRMRTGVG